MIYSLIARVVERIPTIKHLVKRLKRDSFFRFDCGFLLSDDVPSESFYSRMISAISETDALAKIQDVLVAQAIQEGYITEETWSEIKRRASGLANSETKTGRRKDAI